ncbi:MAG: PAS domain S-box protein, partial [Bacteroidota bacterium]
SNKELKGIAVLAENITSRKKSEKMILQFSRLYQFTSAINEMMLRTENKQAIFQEACEIAVRDGKFSMAWIGNFSANTRNIECHAWAGNNDGYLDNLKVPVGESAFGRGIIGNAFRNRKTYYCNDIANDQDMLAWRDDALKQGYRSLISLPIIIGSKLEAIFTLYTEETFFFNEEEVKLIQEVTNNIAYAIEKIELKKLKEKSEQELKESEEKFRKLVEETLVGVFILQEARFVYVNPQFEKISGYSKLELLNSMSFEELIHEDDMEKVWSKYLSRITGEKSSDHYSLKSITKEGLELQVEVIASTITYKSKPAIIATIIDVTEQIAEEVRINKAVTDAQESERQQISMELHDNVKQLMAASMLNIDFIKMNLKDEKKTIQLIDNVKNYIRESIDELRRISHQLSPIVDDTIPLQEKIKTVVNSMNVSNQITVSYQFDKFNKPLENDLQLAMYRILQEQFSNIMKYAEATSVDIAVRKNKNDLRLSIKDNGVGFDTKLKKNGIGLENIQRRVKIFNGKVNIESSPGKGCSLEIKIPALS